MIELLDKIMITAFVVCAFQGAICFYTPIMHRLKHCDVITNGPFIVVTIINGLYFTITCVWGLR